MSVSHPLNSELVELLQDSPAPVYVVDDRRRIVYCNAACSAWLGTTSGEIVGLRCAYHTPAEVDANGAAAAALCPPPKAFCGQSQAAVIGWRDASGGMKYRRARFLPLAEGADESAPVLVVLDWQDCAAPKTSDSDAIHPSAIELHAQLQRLRARLAGRYTANSLLGNSPAMVRARAQIELAATSRAPVLISGPRGVGKTHAAQAIHYSQDRPVATLVSVSCRLLETNPLRAAIRAVRTRVLAGESFATLLVEDVDLLPADVQIELLELLRSRSPRLHVIGTSTLALPALATAEGAMRELAYALGTIAIELPALRERLGDLPLLAQAVLEEVNADALKQLGGFSPEAFERLAAYDWPGNVAELHEMVRAMHELAQAGEVTARDLPSRLQYAAQAAAHPRRSDEPIVLEDYLASIERELIERALRRAKGNKTKAAKLLGLTRPRLYRRLVQLGLEAGDAPELEL